MQVNQINPTGYHVRDRILSFFLALIMLISSVSVPEFSAFAEDSDNSGGFVLTMAWNSNDTNDEEEKDPSKYYKYDSEKNEERIITLKVKYQNKDVSKADYEPGSIIITVPGLKEAVRSEESYLPIAVAADEMSDTNKTHDWSYSYTKTTDTYTFVNNRKIEAKSTFEGSFEIMWRLPSRKTKDAYKQELKGNLNAIVRRGDDVENYEAESNTIYYEQTRTRDEYTIDETVENLYKDEVWSGEEPPIEDYQNYIWAKYTITGTDTYYARDVQGKERFDCYFLEGAIVQGAGLKKADGKTRNDFGDGKTYQCWSVEKDVTPATATFLEGIYVAYPPAYKEEYKDKGIKSYAYLYGTYLDEKEESLLAETKKPTILAKYDFVDIPGPIYNVEKHSYGFKNSYVENHGDTNCKVYGAINASHLSDNKYEYKSALELELNFKDFDGAPVDKDSIDLEYYDLEFVDDIMDISLKEKGEDGSIFRKLEDDEYHFTRIKIPSNQDICNKNGLPIKADTYDVEIYFRRKNGNFSYNLLTDDSIPEPDIKDLKITSSEQIIEIPYNDVVGIKIVVRGVKESFYTDDIYCYYQFDISDDELLKINTNGGQLVNNMYFNLYRKYSGGYEWFNNDFTSDEYSDDREYNRDIKLYRHALDREKADLHILEIPSEFKIKSVNLKETKSTNYIFECNGSITSEFTLGDGADYSKFSMYTILPEDLQLFDNCSTPETLKEVLGFSGEGLSSAYISEHTTIEIIQDYRNSGRQYLAFHYNFDKPITSRTITVSGIPLYVNKDKIEEKSKSYNMYAGMLMDQQGKWYSTSKDAYLIENNNIWVDMDNDGDTEEPASFGNATIEVKNPRESKVELVKFVKTTRTVGYVNPSANEEVPMTYAGGTYSYRLRATVGEDFGVKDFIFFDAIETHKDKEWQGEFESIDYSYAKKVFGNVEPVIYYSTEVEKFKIADDGKSYNITPDDLTKGNWTTKKPDNDKIRSVAVYFGNGAFAKSNSIIYIDIIMKAPDAAVALKNSYYDKVTVNDCSIGYDKVSNDASQNVVHENLPSNDVRVKFVPDMGKIILVKKDAVSGETISTEAKFELYRKTDNKLIGTYTTQNGRIIAKDLIYGDYSFREVEAPKGYELSEKPLEVTLNGEESDISVTVEFENQRKDGQFKIRKVSDRDENCGLQGAEFAVYDLKDNVVKSGLTTDSNGYLTVSGLAWGSYYLEETEAPAGYNISEERIKFEVNADNDAGRIVKDDKGNVLKDDEGRDLEFVIIENEQKPAYATLIKYETLENGVQTTNPLAGAVYELHKADGTLLGTYMTDSNGKIYAEDLTFGDYYFRETIAPKGYELKKSKNAAGEDIPYDRPFTVEARHTSEVLEVSAYDDRKLGRVTLMKLDDEEQPVKGAVYGLFKKDGTKIQEFTTTDEGYIELSGLWWGDYYFKELKAPKGYELDKTLHDFSINKDTVSKRILLNVEDKRQKGKVTLVKTDDSGKTLENAVYTLYRNDGSIYKDNLTTDKSGAVEVTDIPWGSYYFLEKTAPADYGLSAEKIRFSVNYLTAGKVQELSAIDTDNTTYKLTVVKKIKISDIVFSHGNPTFTFKVVSNKGNTYHQAVTFSEEYVKEYQKANPDAEYIDASVVFLDLDSAKYTVTETETNRYKTDKVEATNGNVVGNTAEFVIDSNEKDYKAVFTNEKTTQEGLSHSSQISNILKRSRKYTALVVEWTGADIITTNQLDRDLLNVWAVYDDGTQEKLENNAYTLNPEEFDPDMNGEFTVSVSYTDGGITRSDVFGVTVDVTTSLFTWRLKSKTPFDEGETHYDGEAIINGYTGSAKLLRIPKSVTGWVELKNGVPFEHEEEDYVGKKYKVVGVAGATSDGAMYGISECEALILPDGLETIAKNTFRSCSNLGGDLVIPDSVTSIESRAFLGCGFNGNLRIGNNVASIDNYAFKDCSGFTGSLTIPDNVTSIGVGAFQNCRGFTGSLTISDNITSINPNTFDGCSGFTGSLTIGNKVTSIGNFAFQNCRGFNGSLTIGDSVKTIGTRAFADNNWGTMNFTGDLILPDSLTSVGDHAFFNCNKLDGTLVVPDSITTISDWAFFGCEKLKGSLDLTNVTSLGNRAFANCKALNGELKLPTSSSVTAIRMNTFYECNNLTGTLEIPENIQKIGYGAFYRCRGFSELILHEGLQEISVSTISGENFENCGAFQDCRFKCDLTIPDSVTVIGKDAFNGCTGFEGGILTISKNNSLKEIGSYAFGSCKFDSNKPSNSIQSIVWIPIDADDISDYEMALETVYFNNPKGISDACKLSSKLTVGDDPFWGYQLPYAFFVRN